MRTVEVKFSDLKQGDKYRFSSMDAEQPDSTVLSVAKVRDWLATFGNEKNVVMCLDGYGNLLWNDANGTALVQRPHTKYRDLKAGEQFRFVGDSTPYRKLSVGFVDTETWQNFGLGNSDVRDVEKI